MIVYSVVIPVYNEADNLRILAGEILNVMKSVNASCEVIWIDDGSRDSSLEVIRELCAENDFFRYVSFRVNRGQSTALAAGFQRASGEFVITLDSDLQNDPADIAKMIPHMEEYDMVTGWRKDRHDSRVKRFSSKFANAVRNRLTGETIRDTGCSLKIMRASTLKKIKMFAGMHRFLPTLMKMEGAAVKEVAVSHRNRIHGASKYGVWDRAFSGLRDLLVVRWMKVQYIRYDIKEASDA